MTGFVPEAFMCSNANSSILSAGTASEHASADMSRDGDNEVVVVIVASEGRGGLIVGKDDWGMK
jgi:hypothetical protein